MPNEDLNLVPAIRAIEGQISELKNEYVKKITPYKESLAKLKEINTACESCCGTGKGKHIKDLVENAVQYAANAA